MKQILTLVLLSSILLACTAQKPSVFATKQGAIRGYDPVAYFKQNKPVKGNPDYRFEWNGASWYFASVENLSLFQNQPETYAPAYGGYCAYAVAKGSTASIDPQAWAIVDGTLYLNYSEKIQKTWETNRGTYIEQANNNWPKVLVKKKKE